jgi:K+/H+ antiporter YhaU regulatory subunit KhtT
MTFNPEPKTVLHAGDTVIAVGSTKSFQQFEEIL